MPDSFPTVAGRGEGTTAVFDGATSTSSGGPWHALAGDQADPWDPPGGSGSSTGPRLVIETGAGHQFVVTYHDVVLAALLGGLALEAWTRWSA